MANNGEAQLLERLPRLGEVLTDTDEIFDRFLDYTSALGLELYPAQEEALLEILAGNNVILATPTGSGKSLVALAMHFLAMARDERSVYTSPVKALVNEKFFALCEAFSADNVALLTGDATVNRDAPIFCCTAEILANMALREGASADVQYAILDEFHFYADRDRGVAWQIPLLTMPQTTFLLMSATLGDTEFFEEALTALNGKPTVTVRSNDRPVPLDFSYQERPLHQTIASLIEQDKAPIYVVSFTQRGCHSEAQNMMSVNVCSKEHKRAIAQALKSTRFDTPYGKDLQRFLRHGIGVHHGGMLPKYRRLVERLAQRGLLKVISGTDTLGVGVNIPIRTVVLTKLCKFDGSATRILSVRDFHQICGRAGRKGFDDQGSVVVQAPEHVIENLKLEAKAAANPAKKRKLVKKKPPTKGYVHFNRATFKKLVAGKPEPLSSQFQVRHSMLLDVLGREHGGCAAMKQLVRSCHERKAVKRRIGKTAMQMLRSLVQAKVVEFVDNPDAPPAKRIQVNRALQREFSMVHVLSLFVIETIEQLDEDFESYPLDVLSLVEAILENPTLILRKQLSAIKGEAVAKMKAEGIEYDERMERLEELEYPKPNAEFIYASFNEFADKHPWVGGENIRPKGVARDLYERCLDFRGFVVGYKLEQAEGMVLRYFSEVYKALVQTVPEWARTAEVVDLIDHMSGVVRGVDSSLLDEWEKLRDPDYVPTPPSPETAEPEPDKGITADHRAFTVLTRNAVFGFVRALAQRQYELAATMVQALDDAEDWTAERLERAITPYYEDHESIRLDPRARATEFIRIDESPEGYWGLEQILVDPEEHNDWVIVLRVDLQRSDENSRPLLLLEQIVG